MKTNIRIVAVVCLLLTLFFLVFLLLTTPEKETHPLVGNAAPMMIFDDAIYHKGADVAYAKGLKLVYFVATWCPSCQDASKLVSAIPLPVYVVLFRDTVELSSDLKAMAEVIVRDPKMQKAIEWGVKGIPFLFLVDKQGTVRWHHKGRLTQAVLQDSLYPLIDQLKKDA